MGKSSESAEENPRNQDLMVNDRKAQKLFSTKEEAITFAEGYGFGEAHVELLRTSGRIFESAEVLVNEGKIADAIKTLIAGSRVEACTRRAVEYLLTGLWQHQSFGVDHPTTDPEVVAELLGLGDTLKNDMREREAQEVCLILSYGMALTLGKHSSRCSERGTMPISKHFVFCIPSSPEQKTIPLLCCVLMPASPPLSLRPAPPRSTPGLSFPSILPTSSFWIACDVKIAWM